MEKVIVVIGPTSVGKTKMGVALAKKFNGEVISGDSMQIYKQMDIGTAKVTEEEKEGIIHHCVDILNPDETYSVHDFQQTVRKKITEITQRGHVPIIVGGTGLYIKAALYDYQFDEMENDHHAINEKYKDYTNEQLHDHLKSIDEESAKILHFNNRRRVLRAIEIYETTGKRKSEMLEEQEHICLYDAYFVGLTLPRDVLYERINKRVDVMMENGLKEEMERLYSQGLTRNHQSMKAIGYKEWFDYYDHQIDLNDVLELIKKQVSHDGTTKFLFITSDGALLESVMMVFDYGRSVCVSSQVGCNMGCAFCASGLTKKKRDLTRGEMVAQVMYVQKELDKDNLRLSHIVVMGTGEPFDNYDNVMNFLATVNHDRGLGIGSRHITISTCGIVPRIYDFANEHTQYNLAISLHAPNDELRDKLMPVNHAYPLKELMEAVKYYGQENNRRLTFEYILLNGVNDRPEHAKQLSKLLHGMNAYVNLIPYNAVDEKGFKSVSHDEAMVFYDLLMKNHVRCTIRKEHGNDIDAACGQLRIKEIKKEGI